MRTGFGHAGERSPDSATARGRWRLVALVRTVLGALLVAGVAAGCTVRVELASSRAVPGDLAATSTGLAPHRSLSHDLVDERPQPATQGLALATLLPADDSRGPVELLPALRPATRSADEAVRSPTGSSARPAMARPGEAEETNDQAPTILPAAGPP